MKVDRLKLLCASGIIVVTSLFTMNTVFLFISLLMFVAVVAYNMYRNIQQSKVYTEYVLSEGQQLFLIAVTVLAIFGLITSFLGLLLLI